MFVVNSSLFSFNYLLYELLVQLLIGLLENRLARVALSSSMYYIAIRSIKKKILNLINASMNIRRKTHCVLNRISFLKHISR